MSADQNSHGITSAVGPYSLVAKQLSGQEKILAEYPYLWAVSDFWPIRDLQVTNDAGRFMKFMDQHYRVDAGRLEAWAYVKRDDDSVCVRDISPLAGEAARRRVNLPFETPWGKILGSHLDEEMWTVIVVERDETIFTRTAQNVVLFRNKDRARPLNPLVDIWQRVNS